MSDRLTAAGALTIVVVYPELMGTYGDGGNAVALRARCTRRGACVDQAPAVMGAGIGTPRTSLHAIFRNDAKSARKLR